MKEMYYERFYSVRFYTVEVCVSVFLFLSSKLMFIFTLFTCTSSTFAIGRLEAIHVVDAGLAGPDKIKQKYDVLFFFASVPFDIPQEMQRKVRKVAVNRRRW